jgi:hypothetical protein
MIFKLKFKLHTSFLKKFKSIPLLVAAGFFFEKQPPWGQDHSCRSLLVVVNSCLVFFTSQLSLLFSKIEKLYLHAFTIHVDFFGGNSRLDATILTVII